MRKEGDVEVRAASCVPVTEEVIAAMAHGSSPTISLPPGPTPTLGSERFNRYVTEGDRQKDGSVEIRPPGGAFKKVHVIVIHPVYHHEGAQAPAFLPYAFVGRVMDHEELIREMPQLEKVPVQERLKLARKRRVMQLDKWKQREREFQKKEKARMNGMTRRSSHKVQFHPCVMLQEAAARGDIDEVR
ncbi:unnamed protein product [Darwinula stevensoni]|uniref:Uncharacterized protein n=1 Tax=Darwinula stevensoni TaxID=69355 RepID=A0A7R8X5J2_9CRUS|nr:unnamed protein product [Darwinula stevensoni]CAG0878662.1 unnamed protein product [Darwinula stevensoni]